MNIYINIYLVKYKMYNNNSSYIILHIIFLYLVKNVKCLCMKSKFIKRYEYRYNAHHNFLLRLFLN